MNARKAAYRRREQGRAALLICTCLAVGCSHPRSRVASDDAGPPIRGGTLEIVGNSDVDHLSTTDAYMTTSWWLLGTFARRLLAYPPSSDNSIKIQPVPDIAREVPTAENGGVSPDGLTYTFHLRRGVRWDTSPPREVNAHDVVRAFKLMFNPVGPVGAPAYYTSTIAGMERYADEFARVPGTVEAIREFVNSHEIDGVHAADDTTLVFRLRSPAPDFLYLVASPFTAPVPVEYLDYLTDSPEFRQHTISNGPYRITRYVQNREYLLERNPVWDPRTDAIRPAYMDRIRIRLGLDPQLQQLQIEAGTADMSFGEVIPTAELAALLATDDPTAWVAPSGEFYAGFWYLVINQMGPNNGGALTLRSVRQALALAVDKAAVVQLLGGPQLNRPLRQATPSCAAGYREGADQYVTPRDRGDAVMARRLLADAGFPAGISLRLAYGIFPGTPQTAQALQASLKRAGFEVSLHPFTEAEMIGRLLANSEAARRGEWDLALLGWFPDWYGANNGRSVVSPLFDGRHYAQNYGGYRNRKVDAAIDRALAALSAANAEEAWADAAWQVMEDVGIVPLVEVKQAYARSRRVRNCSWSVQGMSADLNAVWLSDAAPRSAARP